MPFVAGLIHAGGKDVVCFPRAHAKIDKGKHRDDIRINTDNVLVFSGDRWRQLDRIHVRAIDPAVLERINRSYGYPVPYPTAPGATVGDSISAGLQAQGMAEFIRMAQRTGARERIEVSKQTFENQHCNAVLHRCDVLGHVGPGKTLRVTIPAVASSAVVWMGMGMAGLEYHPTDPIRVEAAPGETVRLHVRYPSGGEPADRPVLTRDRAR